MAALKHIDSLNQIMPLAQRLDTKQAGSLGVISVREKVIKEL
jgi:hypothetical protein